mgnify:CR=1 FL=1
MAEVGEFGLLAALWSGNGFTSRFAKRFRSFELAHPKGGPPAVSIDRDSFLEFVYRDLLA